MHEVQRCDTIGKMFADEANRLDCGHEALTRSENSKQRRREKWSSESAVQGTVEQGCSRCATFDEIAAQSARP